MKEYIIQFKGELTIQAEDEESAKKSAIEEFKKLKNIKISEEKLIDKESGYFLK